MFYTSLCNLLEKDVSGVPCEITTSKKKLVIKKILCPQIKLAIKSLMISSSGFDFFKSLNLSATILVA